MGRGGNTDRGQGTKIGMVGGAHREWSMGRVDKGEHGVGEGVREKVSRHREESTRVGGGGWERADRHCVELRAKHPASSTHPPASINNETWSRDHHTVT